MEVNRIYNEDCLETMSRMTDGSVDLIVTSPPYNKSRAVSQYALEHLNCHYKDFDDAKSNEEYLEWTLERFHEFERILKDDGCICYNISYATDENRMSELMWLVVADIIKNTGFTVADRIIWRKQNAIPNNVSANKLTRICEDVFVFCKRKSYETFHSNKKVVGESVKGQKIYENLLNVIYAANNDGACDIHKATYSTHLCYQLLDLYGFKGGLVYDPFIGTGTTALAALEWGMDYVGSEISAEYCELAEKRIGVKEAQPSLF